MAPPFRFVRLEPAQPSGEPAFRLCLEPYEGPAQWITFSESELQELVDSATDLLPEHTPPPYVPRLPFAIPPLPGCTACGGTGQTIERCAYCDGDGAA